MLLSGDTVRVTIANNSVGFAGSYSQLRDGNEHTISVSWSNSGVLRLYIDGEYQEQLTGVNTGYTIASGGNLIIGNDQDAMGAQFQTSQAVEGTLHNIRIFDDVRSDTEIATAYRSDLPFDEANMVADWRFDHLSSEGVVTDSVSGNNLTVKHVTEPGFTASEATLTFAIEENAIDGTVVGSVSVLDIEREAQVASLLAGNSNLFYNAETGKFYEYFATPETFANALTNATSTTLNGVNGQLITIADAYENAYVANLIAAQGILDAHLGATDATVEGEWRWLSGGTESSMFWRGDGSGSNVNGAFVGWNSGEPNDVADEDYAGIFSDGTWNDGNGSVLRSSFVEYDADDVLDATQAITYSIQSQSVAGAFEIDSDTGRITVADGTLLDADTLSAHTITIRTTDVDSNTYDEVFTISLNNLVEANNAPTDLSSGIELNSDGGNDAYFEAANGDAVLGGATNTTIEMSLTIDNSLNFAPHLFNYSTASEDFEFRAFLTAADTLSFGINGLTTSLGDVSDIVDGEVHHVALSWDNTNGDVLLYIDGELRSTAQLGAGHTIGTGGTLTIGQGDPASGKIHQQALHGNIYDVRIWNEVRSEAEITLNHQHKFDGGSLPSGLVANWQMDGFNGSNEVVDVVSGNNLSVGHASGAGFTASTPVEDLHIAENSANGTSVGYVVPSDPDISNDLVSDGQFLKGDTGAWTDYTQGQSFGDWTVESGAVSHTSQYESLSGGVGLELQRIDGEFPSAITQTLATEVGRQYQLVFNMTGNFSGGDPVKYLVASAGGESMNFSVTDTSGPGDVYEQRAMTFTADSTSTVLRFASGADDGWAAVISDVRVIEIPQAVTTILNNDATLSYDAATGKFYRFVNTPDDFATALVAATGAELNGVGGQLVTIRSEYENELIRQYAIDSGNSIWLGTHDTNNDGNWNWLDGEIESSEQFWTGGSGGSATSDHYASTFGQSELAGEDYARINNLGNWADVGAGANHAYVIEWDASEVLSSFTFSLTDNAGGRFAIDATTGEITVADGSLIDYETATSHNVTVETTDAAGNTYSESMTIAIDDVIDANTAPTFSASGPGGFGGSNLIASDGVAAASVSTGDFDGDGDLDVVAANQNTDAITWYESDGNGGFIASHTISLAVDGPLSVYVSDVDGDGDFDVLSASTTDNQIAWFENDGAGSFTMHSITTGASGATGVAATDLDGDGDVDILASASSAGALYWYENDGSENFTTHVLATGATAARMITFEDVNQDGHMDVLTASYGDDTIAWYENDGSQNFTERQVTTTADGARYVQAIDLDADGDLDLVGSSGLNDEIFWFENDGSENFSKHLLSSSYGDVWSLQVSDLDLDGDLDITFADFANPSDVVWLENDGLESFSVNTIATGVGNPNAIALGDLDDDGDLDVLTTSWSGGDVNWYENLAQQTTLDSNPTYVEGGAAVVLDANVEIYDQELSVIDDFGGASLTLARQGGADAEDVFSATGNLAFVGTTTGNIELSSVVVGTYSNTSGTLTLNFAAGTTGAQVNQVMQSIAYSNSSNTPPVAVQIDWTFDDGNGGAQGSGGALQATGSTTVDIVATNDDPTNAGSLPTDITVTEDVSSNVDLSAIDLSDVDHAGGNPDCFAQYRRWRRVDRGRDGGNHDRRQRNGCHHVDRDVGRPEHVPRQRFKPPVSAPHR